MTVRFVIVCASRTGSTLTRWLLCSHPRLCCHGELLPPRDTMWGLHGLPPETRTNVADYLNAFRARDPLAFVRDVALYPGRFAAVGFKVLYHQLLDPAVTACRDWLLADTEIRIVHLKRINALRRFVSNELALQTGVMVARSESRRPVYRKLALTFERCVADIEATRAGEARFDALFAAHPVFQAQYERIADPADRQRDDLLAFLGVESAPLDTTMLKLGAENLADVVEDYAALQRQARGTAYADLFD